MNLTINITLFNGNRLTRQPFFGRLIDYLDEVKETNYRELQRHFYGEAMDRIDREIEKIFNAGYIWRQNGHYGSNVKIFDDEDFDLSQVMQAKPQINLYDQPFLVRADSRLCQLIKQSIRYQRLAISENLVSFSESSDFARQTPTLSNYFYKVAENLSLTAFEQEIYELVGDVRLDYALTYLTIFLLKLTEKESVKSKPNIFVALLEKYGLVKRTPDGYKLLISYQKQQKIPTQSFDDPHDFIQAQIQQQEILPTYLSLPSLGGQFS